VLFSTSDATDASGNATFQDIRVHLRDGIVAHFRERNLPLNLKHLDPSYYIRSVAASPSDSVYCWNLARNEVDKHGDLWRSVVEATGQPKSIR